MNPQHLAVSLSSQRNVFYNTAQRYSTGSSRAEVDLHQRSAEQTNLSVGTESVGSLETFQNNPPRVRESIVRDSRRLFPPFQRKPNAPKIQRENYVCGGVDNRNPSNGQVVDLAIADTSGSRPRFTRIRLSAVPLLEVGSSIGLSKGRGQGNLRCPLKGIYER